MPYQGYYTISRLQCHQRSKQNPPKTFPVKENCHTIKSAGVHAFHPHLSFCLKLSRFIPAFHILSFFYPYESPPFDTSPGDIKEATLEDVAMCLAQRHRGCNRRQVNVPPCSNKLWVTQIRTSPCPLCSGVIKHINLTPTWRCCRGQCCWP